MSKRELTQGELDDYDMDYFPTLDKDTAYRWRRIKAFFWRLFADDDTTGHEE